MSNQKVIKASEFKAKCLHLMDHVAKNNQELIITKHHKPIAKLVPFKNKPESLFGINKDKIKILKDIVPPIDVEWNAETGEGWDELL